jgi:predicted GNAT family N-acyltransferase
MMTEIETLHWADGQVPPLWHQALDQTIAASFGGWGLDKMPQAHRRCAVVGQGKVLSHAAAQSRVFALPTGSYTGYIIGGVCTAPGQRGHGMGTRVTLELLGALKRDGGRFAVLNCGAERLAFYRRMGFTQVAPQASYCRDGKPEIDDDPVMGIALGAFDLVPLKMDIFPLQTDF